MCAVRDPSASRSTTSISTPASPSGCAISVDSINASALRSTITVLDRGRSLRGGGRFLWRHTDSGGGSSHGGCARRRRLLYVTSRWSLYACNRVPNPVRCREPVTLCHQQQTPRTAGECLPSGTSTCPSLCASTPERLCAAFDPRRRPHQAQQANAAHTPALLISGVNIPAAGEPVLASRVRPVGRLVETDAGAR